MQEVFKKIVSCCSMCTWRPEGTHAMARGRCLKQLGPGDAVRSPSTGPGQRLGRGPGGEAPGILSFLRSQNGLGSFDFSFCIHY